MPILRNFLLFTLPLASRVAFHSINNSVKTKNFCGNFPEDSENVEFPKIGAFKISGNSGRKVRYKGNSRQEMSENLGQFSFPNILKNVVLFVTGNFWKFNRKGPSIVSCYSSNQLHPGKRSTVKEKCLVKLRGFFISFSSLTKRLPT